MNLTLCGWTYLYKVVDGLQVGQVIIIQVNTDTEEKACIPSVHYLEIPELFMWCIV